MRSASGGRHAARPEAPRRRRRPALLAVPAVVLTALPVAVMVSTHRADTTVAVDTAAGTTPAPTAAPMTTRPAALSRAWSRQTVVRPAAPIARATTPAATPSTYTPPDGLSDAPCPDSSVERGLAADTIRVYRAVCHAFPQVTDYLGWGPRPEHDTGHAIDVMVYGDKALGDEVAAWAQAHAAELDLYDVIWYDRIWTPARASEGWRDYGDHGSATANHMDHVHIGTN